MLSRASALRVHRAALPRSRTVVTPSPGPFQRTVLHSFSELVRFKGGETEVLGRLTPSQCEFGTNPARGKGFVIGRASHDHHSTGLDVRQAHCLNPQSMLAVLRSEGDEQNLVFLVIE